MDQPEVVPDLMGHRVQRRLPAMRVGRGRDDRAVAVDQSVAIDPTAVRHAIGGADDVVDQVEVQRVREGRLAVPRDIQKIMRGVEQAARRGIGLRGEVRGIVVVLRRREGDADAGLVVDRLSIGLVGAQPDTRGTTRAGGCADGTRAGADDDRLDLQGLGDGDRRGDDVHRVRWPNVTAGNRQQQDQQTPPPARTRRFDGSRPIVHPHGARFQRDLVGHRNTRGSG